MYICNHVALDLGLEGTPDPSLKVLQAAVTAKGYKGYVCPGFVAAAPVVAPTGGTGTDGTAKA